MKEVMKGVAVKVVVKEVVVKVLAVKEELLQVPIVILK